MCPGETNNVTETDNVTDSSSIKHVGTQFSNTWNKIRHFYQENEYEREIYENMKNLMDTQIFSHYFFVDKSGFHTPSISVNSMMTSSKGNIFRVTDPLWGEFADHWIPLTKPVTRNFDAFFDLRLNKRVSKQSRRRCFEVSSPHYDVTVMVRGWYYLMWTPSYVEISIWRDYTTQVIIGCVSTAPQIAKVSNRHGEQ